MIASGLKKKTLKVCESFPEWLIYFSSKFEREFSINFLKGSLAIKAASIETDQDDFHTSETVFISFLTDCSVTFWIDYGYSLSQNILYFNQEQLSYCSLKCLSFLPLLIKKTS
jgi:hypothetical protein